MPAAASASRRGDAERAAERARAIAGEDAAAARNRVPAVRSGGSVRTAILIAR